MEVGRPAVDHLVRAHYLHRWPAVVTGILALMDNGRPIGTIVFALPPRETGIRYRGKVWELARLFIEDGTPKNTETWFACRAIRWVRTCHPEVMALVSYADPEANHNGTIYRAGNWISDGRTEERRLPRSDYFTERTESALFQFRRSDLVKHSRKSHAPSGESVIRAPRVSKFRFVYWLDGKHEQRRQAAIERKA